MRELFFILAGDDIVSLNGLIRNINVFLKLKTDLTFYTHTEYNI